MAYLPEFDSRLDLDPNLINKAENLINAMYSGDKQHCDTNINMLKKANSEYTDLMNNKGMQLSISDRKNTITSTLIRLSADLTLMQNQNNMK